MTPIKAIRAKCLDCCCGQYKEVELCPCSDCSLYPYRFGKNPNIKLTDEQRAVRAANLKKNASQQGEKLQGASSEGNDIPPRARPPQNRAQARERRPTHET